MVDEVTKRKRSEEMRKIQQRVMVPGGCRAYMRRVLAQEFVEIVRGFVEEAKKGSCPHVKLATELMKPVRKGPAVTRKKGSAARFYEKLERERTEQGSTKRVD